MNIRFNCLRLPKRIPAREVSALSSALTALLFTAILATIVIGFLPPFWETNDDVAMAMILDGYGLAAYPSPGIVFSNILYGYALAALPQIGDISRYSLGAISLNLLSVLLICRALCLLTQNYVLTLSVMALISLPPLIFPQFTVLGGMLSVAGILHIASYLQRRQTFELVIAGFVLFIGYLIRSHEFFLIVLISSVILPWRGVLGDRRLQGLIVVLIGLGAAAMLADWRYYQAPEWQAFRELNLVRAPFTDYGAAAYFLEHPGLLKGANYTPNDIVLLQKWFLADPLLADPERLSALLSRVDPASFMGGNLARQWATLPLLLAAPLVYVLVPAVVAGTLTKNRIRLGLAWLVLIVVIVGLMLTGRGVINRVLYAPLVLLLCLGTIQVSRPLSQWVLIGAIGLAALGTVLSVTKRHAHSMEQHALIRTDLATVDKSKLYVVWGNLLDYESMYPVLGSMTAARELRLYALGVTSLAPFAVAHWKDAPGGLLPGRLTSGAPVPFFAEMARIDLLSIYCEERHSTKLRVTGVQQLRSGNIFTVTCGAPSYRP